MKQPINEIKRMQQLAGLINENQDVEEGLGKALGTAALGAALAFGSPKAQAQEIPQGTEQTAFDSTFNIKNMDDEKAGEALVLSYRDNPFTADMWGKSDPGNGKLFTSIKRIADQARERDIQPEEIAALGRKWKNTMSATEFLDRANALKTAKMKGLEETIDEALADYRKKKLKEANEQTDPIADKDAEQGLKQALAILKSGGGTVKPSPQDGKVDEAVGLALGLVAGAPGLISLLGKSVNAVSSLFQKDKKQGTTVGNALKHLGHKLEGYYLGAIGDILKKAFPKTYSQQDVTDHNSDLYKTAHAVYAAILAAAAISSGLGAAQAHSTTAAGLEGGLSAFKSSEVIGLAQKIASASQV